MWRLGNSRRGVFMLILAFTHLCLILTVHSASEEDTKWAKLVKLKRSAAAELLLRALARGRGGWRGEGWGWGGDAAVKYYSALLEESGTGCPQESNYCKTAERKEVAPDFPDAIYVSPPSPSAGETLSIRVAAVQNRPGEPVEVKTCPPLLSVRSKKKKTLKKVKGWSFSFQFPSSR